MHLIRLPPQPAGIVAFLAFGIALSLVRNPLPFLYPIAAWEDGTQGITLYDNPAAPLFHFQVGYIHALPDIIDFLAMRLLPLPWVPFALAWLPLLIAACLPLALFGFFRNALRQPPAAAALCAAVVAILPLANWILVSNTDYCIWNLTALLLLSLWNPVPPGAVQQVVYVGWRALAFASNPLGLPALLVWAWLLVTRRAGPSGGSPGRAALAALVALAGLYAVAGIRHGQAVPPLTPAILAPLAAMTLHLAVGASFLDLLPGSAALAQLSAATRIIVEILALAALVTLLVAARTRPGPAATRRVLLETVAVVACILAMCGICALGRGIEKGPAWMGQAPRFAYVPSLLWCSAIAAAVADTLRRWQSAPARNTLAAVCTVLVLLIVAGRAAVFRWDDKPASQRLEAFLTDASRRIAAGDRGPFRLPRIDPYGDWTIVIAAARPEPSASRSQPVTPAATVP